ncbi:MAG: hypothetical protein H5T69_19630 [Chloroflexi bacterium]|nr:hypothetical protein [Chloroflexota bacterium]
MFIETYCAAFEHMIARLIMRFQETPDLYLRQEDLLSAAFAMLQEEPMLARPYRTRDGRLTSLIHRDYPAFFAFPNGLSMAEDVLFHPLALLDPRFVRGHPFEVVANVGGAGARALRELTSGLLKQGFSNSNRPVALIATARLLLLAELGPAQMEALREAFFALLCAEPDAQRLYLIVLLRHWDLEQQIARALDVLGRWAENHPQVSAVVAQSYRDDIGSVFGGRYLNLWSQMAPLPPLNVVPQIVSSCRP